MSAQHDARERALECPVYVVANHFAPGVRAPGERTTACAKRGCTAPHAYDWREPPGSAANPHGIRAELVRAAVRDVIERSYPGEHHFAAYEISRDGVPLERQPRVTKSSLSWLRSEGYEVRLTALLADLDTANHVPWTPELRAEFDALWARAEGPLATCAAYLSPKGVRLVQPLERPVPVDEGERYLHRWLDELVAVGADPSVREAKDWTRLMRVANHVRDVHEAA